MKKFRNLICTALILTFSVLCLSACKFSFSLGSDYTQFEINYTQNLEFLVGEDYHDDILKGYGTKKDGTKEDVTSKMTIDSSAYSKNIPGTYAIKCVFEGTTLSYDVKVVEEITNLINIQNRFSEVVENTFVRDENGLFEYTSTNVSNLMLEGDATAEFAESLIYQDDDGQILAYLTWAVNGEPVSEFWYEGTEEEGFLTVKAFDEETEQFEVTKEESNLMGFAFALGVAGQLTEIPVTVIPLPYVEAIELGTSATLTVDAEGVYTIIAVEYDEDLEEDIETVYEYKNNVLVGVDGANYDFSPESTTIPTVPEATVTPEPDPVV